MTIVSILANPQFTKRYAWNDTFCKVVWEGTVLRVVEVAPFTKFTYKCSKVDRSLWRTSKVPGLHHMGWKTSKSYSSMKPAVVSSA